MKRIAFSLTICLLILSLFQTNVSTVQAAAIRYVKPAATGDADCTSWANACTLQTALNAAETDDEIWVAQGIYRRNTGYRTTSFDIDYNVTMYGGFPPTGDPVLADRDPISYPTVLSGDQLGDDPTDANGVLLDWSSVSDIDGDDNSYNVIKMTSPATLDGFIVTSGHGNASYAGAGIYVMVSGVHVVLRNMVFQGNHTDGPGGAIYLQNSGATIEHTSFISNAAAQGGAFQIIYTPMFTTPMNVTLNDVLFENNYAGLGSGQHSGGAINGGGDISGIHQIIMTDVRFFGNRAMDYSGAIDLVYIDATLNNVRIQGNESLANNRVVYCQGATWTITNIVMSGNKGHAMNNSCTTTMTNATIIGNSRMGISNGGTLTLTNAKISGNGETGIKNGGTVTLTNVTISGNKGIPNAGAISNFGIVNLRNSIVWNNGSDAIYLFSGTASIDHSLLQGGCPPVDPMYVTLTCNNLLSTDPNFVTPVDYATVPTTAGDLHLQSGSPAIDTGDKTVTDPTLPATDLDGWTRIVNDTVDMGAYEFHPSTAVIVSGFEAEGQFSAPTIRWTAMQQAGLIGFNLYRASSAEGERVLVNASLVPANAQEYIVNDFHAQPGEEVFYWLEVLREHDTELLGPITLKINFWNYLPALRK